MSEPGLVVIVDGPSCVGRSTTVAALQAAWPEVRGGPLLAIGLEAMLASFGPSQSRWRPLVAPSVSPSVSASDGDDQHEVGQARWGPLGIELIEAMHRAVGAWAHAGVDVVVDHLLLDKATARDLATVLAGLGTIHVGLVCDPDILEDRERERYGTATAVAQQQTTQDVAVRDLVLDTSQSTTDELVEAVLIDVKRLLRTRR